MVEDEIIASPRPSVVNPQYERLTENLESVKNTSNPGTARQDTLRRLFKFIQTNQRTPGTSAPLENSSDEIQGQTYFMDAQQLQQRAYQLALIRTLFGREHVPTVDICIDMAVANGWLSAAALTKHVVVVSRNVQRHILYEKLMLQTLSTGMKCTNDNTIAGKLVSNSWSCFVPSAFPLLVLFNIFTSTNK